MRCHEFRGYVDVEDSYWVFGYLKDDETISNDKGLTYIIPESIGEFTGSYDINKAKIFENDLVKDLEDEKIYKVEYSDEYAAFICINAKTCEFEFYLGDFNTECLEIVGNTFEVHNEEN